MTVLVGIDVGTTGVKGLAIDSGGAILARSEVGYPLSTPRPGWAEQDPEDWWRATKQALGELRDAVGRFDGIGLSGQMHGLVALDADDRVLRPAILWNDQRTGAECEEIERTIGLERLLSLTGNRALPGFTAPKLLWLRRHEPEVYARIARIALPKDYVRLRLCGEHAIDVADASGTLLLDVAGRRWSEEVLTALELDPGWLPRVLESPEVSGRSPDGVPIAAGAGDQAAGALGVGVDRPGPLSVAARDLRRGVRRARSVRRRRRRTRARVLPRSPRGLARDGRDAVGGRFAAVAARHDRRRRVIRRADRRGRRRGTPGPRG